MKFLKQTILNFKVLLFTVALLSLTVISSCGFYGKVYIDQNKNLQENSYIIGE